MDALKEVGRQHGEHGAESMVVAFRRYFDFMQGHLGMRMPFDWRDVKVPMVKQKEQPVFEDHELATLLKVMETMEAGSVHGRRMSWTMQVFFSERAVRKLQEYENRRNDLSDALFVNSCGERLIMATAKSYFERLKRRLRDAGHPEIAAKLKSHTFRRTLATYLLENGADIKSVQAIMDHESERTTIRHYIRLNKKRAQLIHQHILSRFSVDELSSRRREKDGRLQVRMTENLGRWMTLRNDEISPEFLGNVADSGAAA